MFLLLSGGGEWVPLNDPQAKQGPHFRGLTALRTEHPLPDLPYATPKIKSPQINRQTYIERGLKWKQRKAVGSFRISTSLSPTTSEPIHLTESKHFGKPRSVADWHTRWGEFWSWIAFFFLLYVITCWFQSGQCCWRSHASFSVAGVLWPLPLSRVCHSFGPVPPGHQSNPDSCPWKKEEKENTE